MAKPEIVKLMDIPSNAHKTALSALTVQHGNGHGAGKTAALKRMREQMKGRQETEVVDPLEAIPVPDAQAVAHHDDFIVGDQVCICGVYYKVQKKTRRDLVLRRLRPTEIQA